MKVHACDLAPNDLRSAARPTLSKYRAGERVARSIDAQRRESSALEESGATLYGSTPERSSQCCASDPFTRTDASVTIRPLIPTPAQRVSNICAETDVLQR
jgi:hypothetical protein